jgi:hypothetical protein
VVLGLVHAVLVLAPLMLVRVVLELERTVHVPGVCCSNQYQHQVRTDQQHQQRR